ncbi:hypothetical protein PLICRDRAFT_241920 [Plicaturopsis crispa FD-325 SS-3]|nr:hypothetical protein PLICRDRAFT_241920 [Plicaturopsis crispa FD-325 SS-3]
MTMYMLPMFPHSHRRTCTLSVSTRLALTGQADVPPDLRGLTAPVRLEFAMEFIPCSGQELAHSLTLLSPFELQLSDSGHCLSRRTNVYISAHCFEDHCDK